MILLLLLCVSAGTYFFWLDYILDAMEFTCIDYDPTPLIPVPNIIKYEDKYKTELATIPDGIPLEYVIERYDCLLKQSITEITTKTTLALDTACILTTMEEMNLELCALISVKDEMMAVAKSQLIQERISNLKYSMVMEYTPVGNVIMYYKNDAFEYYSDNTVPYRYLDTVCRKYVIRNLCTPLYVDINNEIKESYQPEPIKKQADVFVKLKNYKKQPSIKVKARTNKYLYQGRMNNFSFMKQAVRESSLSFTDYKKMDNICHPKV